MRFDGHVVTRLGGTDPQRGDWHAVVGAPDARLRPLLVRPYVDFAQTGGHGGASVMAPSGTVSLLLSLGGQVPDIPAAAVAGISGHSLTVEDGGEIAGLDVKLSPLGAYRLIGVPMDELVDRAVALEDLAGPVAARELMERLADEPMGAERFRVLDAFLLDRAERGPAPVPAIEWACARLVATGGRAPIGTLAAEIGCSHRHLIAQFRRHTGLSPKHYARIVRFQRLRRLLHTSEDWARLAADCGYADQSHLGRDVRELAGTTPTELRRREVNSVLAPLARDT